jgi:Skp family chaperone for outer membrane proteins
MHRRTFTFWGAAILATAFMIPTAHAQEDLPTRVGVCNLIKVLGGLDEFNDINKALQDEHDKNQKSIDDQTTKIKSMQDQLSIFKPDSADYAKLSQDIFKAQVELKSFAEISDAALAREQKEKLKALSDKMDSFIAQEAKIKHFSLILADQKTDIKDSDMEKIDMNTLKAMLFQRTVLFSENRLDITQDVILLMNQAYAGNAPKH